MSRPVLSLARASKPTIPRALIKQAVRLHRNPLAPRSVRRHNARSWLRSKLLLGSKHVLHINQPPVKWGVQKGIRT